MAIKHVVSNGLMILLDASIRSLSILLLFPTTLYAQITLPTPNRQEKTHIAPAYFGPNAFPVPEMLDDAVSENLEVSLRGDLFIGDYGDHTGSLMASLRIPLFTPRVNLVAWMPVVERYNLSTEWIRNAPIDTSTPHKGWTTGTIFLSTDILLLQESRYRPAIAIRACMKTAAEKNWEAARYYDCPGYFFDLSVGKSLIFRNNVLKRLRVGVSGGFLCWQTDNARQNDATMYALKLTAGFKYLSISQDIRGYFGWERDGDCPMVIKTTILGNLKRYTPYIEYQKGLKDYPYQQLSLGLKVAFDILHKRSKRDRLQHDNHQSILSL